MHLDKRTCNMYFISLDSIVFFETTRDRMMKINSSFQIKEIRN